MTAAPLRLFLLRHAHASPPQAGQRDHLRALDARGRADAETVGATVARMGFSFDRIVCSTARRAAETLDAVRPHLAAQPPEDTSDELYASGIEAYYASANRFADSRSLLLVGHNPTIEDFAASLCRDGEPKAMARLKRGFPTAGLAVVVLAGAPGEVRPGSGRLEALIVPPKG